MKDWKEIKERLEDFGNTKLVNSGRLIKPNTRFTTTKMKKLWDLFHTDRYTSYTKLLFSVGLNGRCDMTSSRNWYRDRGWGEIPERKDLSDKFGEEFVKLYNQGWSGNRISEHYNVYNESVYKILTKMGVNFGQEPITSEDIQLWKQRRKEGVSYQKISNETGRSRDTIKQYMKKEGLVKVKSKVRFIDTHYDKIVELYKQNISITEISKITKLTRTTTTRILKKYKESLVD